MLTGCFHVYDKPVKTNWRVYVWDFVSRHKKNDKLTTNLTNEFEEAFISTQCCDVLERREYDKLVSHGVYMTDNIAEGRLITGLSRIEGYKVIEKSQIEKLYLKTG